MLNHSGSHATIAGPTLRSTPLDILRSIAIIIVILYHSVQMSPVHLPRVAVVTRYGEYGVDLFFVLSGWLIGGLYWREVKIFGAVDIRRFWARRWVRTFPPYCVALVASWLAVHSARGEPFDWKYIVFMQNYYETIPYFLVSWSLCIEEHFYLAAPVIAGALILYLPRKTLWLSWVLLISLSPLLRSLEWLPTPPGGFGYAVTATHLRLDGLVLGFGLSYLTVFATSAFARIATWSVPIILTCLVAISVLEVVGGELRYVLWPSLIAMLFATVVAAVGSREYSPYAMFGVRRLDFVPWTAIALCSYSAYLVHPLAIHVALSVVRIADQEYLLLYWPGVVILIVASTAVFSACIEKPSIVLRDLWIPSRRAVPSTTSKLHRDFVQPPSGATLGATGDAGAPSRS
jgi:peptidoglycan/LPS O-acetylase OafA/YrhL